MAYLPSLRSIQTLNRFFGASSRCAYIVTVLPVYDELDNGNDSNPERHE